MLKKVTDFIDSVKNIKKTYTVIAVAAHDSSVLHSISDIYQYGIIEPILVGNEIEIKSIAEKESIDISKMTIINKNDLFECIDTSFEIVKENNNYILMKGKVPTSDFIKNVLQRKYNLMTRKVISHIGIFNPPDKDKLVLLTDSGINIAPNLRRKQDIIFNAVSIAHLLGIKVPKVALLSFVENVKLSQISSATDSVALVEMAKNNFFPESIIEGPYALDNAISVESKNKKGIKGKVAGDADILIAHDINMANAIYKSLQVWVKATIAGVVAGCKMPIIASSRADNRHSRLQSIALAIYLMENNYPKIYEKL